MNDYFIWNGASSADYGIVVTALPEVILPPERVTYTEIPGRGGSYTTLQGADVYDDITYSCECYVRDLSRVREIASFLRGGGRVSFPNMPGGYYDARIINQIPFVQVLRGNAARSFAVNFRCKPAFHLTEGDTPVSVTNGQYIVNPTGCVAKPKIEINGYGNIRLLVGQDIVELSEIVNGVTLDSELEEAFQGDENLNSHMTGEFPVFSGSSTAISWTGGTVSGVTVTPRWVML